ncbi:MAG: ribosomal protein [Gammaproteobacteria bacterium]|jgi:large subunit ribosomal protein L31|nr:ribosomal protein [Gammaproteobacteria bacterium]
MKKETHPEYQDVTFNCSCGHALKTRSTIKGGSFHVEVCSKCHPFYTGKQKVVDTAGRVDKFKKRFGTITKKKEEAAG